MSDDFDGMENETRAIHFGFNHKSKARRASHRGKINCLTMMTLMCGKCKHVNEWVRVDRCCYFFLKFRFSMFILFDRFHCQVFIFSLRSSDLRWMRWVRSDQSNAWWFFRRLHSVTFFSVWFRLDHKFITHNINLHIENVCTSYLLMIRYKRFIKIDHKANENIRLLNSHTKCYQIENWVRTTVAILWTHLSGILRTTFNENTRKTLTHKQFCWDLHIPWFFLMWNR